MGAPDRAARPCPARRPRRGVRPPSRRDPPGGHVDSPPELAHGRARDRDPRRRRDGRRGQDRPGSTVDIVATYQGDSTRGPRTSPRWSSPAPASSRSGSRALKGGNGVREQQQDPEQVVPVTFALTPAQVLRVTHAESFAQEVRLALLRPRRDVRARQKKERSYSQARAVSQRLLIAIADQDRASAATALAARATRSRSSSASSTTPRSSPARCGAWTSTWSALHDALGTVPVIELAREIAVGFPEVGMVLLGAGDVARAAAHGDAGRHPRRRRAPALARPARGERPRRRPVVARAARARGGRGGRGGALGGAADRRRRRQGRRRHHHRRDAARAGRGRAIARPPGLPRRLRPPEGRPARVLDMPHRRSVVDLVEVAGEISVRHLQETLYTHSEGVRVLLAPEEGERAEEVDFGVARNVLGAVALPPRADRRRPRRQRVRGERDRRRDGEQGADRRHARRRRAARRAPAARAVAAPAGARRRRRRSSLLNRASRKREVQPDLARKVVGGRLAETTIPADFAAFEAAVNTGSPSAAGGRQAARRLRGAGGELDVVPAPEEDEAAERARRAACSRGSPASAARRPSSSWACCRSCSRCSALWQLGLIGYTYMLAGHAAREGARELAVSRPTDAEEATRRTAQARRRSSRRRGGPAPRSTARTRSTVA